MVTAELARQITEQNNSPMCQIVTKAIIGTAKTGYRSVTLRMDGWELYQIQDRLKSLGYQVIEDDHDVEQNISNVTIKW